jgi:hypothetical protein
MSEAERSYLSLATKRYGLRGMGEGSALDRIPPERTEHFIYGTEEAGVDLAVAAGSTARLTMDITQEADYIATKAVDFAILGAAANTWSVAMVASDTDRQLQNQAIPRANFFGTAQLPGIFSKARILWRNTRLVFTVTRVIAGAVAPDKIWIALWGYKVFYDLSNLNLTTRQM